MLKLAVHMGMMINPNKFGFMDIFSFILLYVKIVLLFNYLHFITCTISLRLFLLVVLKDVVRASKEINWRHKNQIFTKAWRPSSPSFAIIQNTLWGLFGEWCGQCKVAFKISQTQKNYNNDRNFALHEMH